MRGKEVLRISKRKYHRGKGYPRKGGGASEAPSPALPPRGATGGPLFFLARLIRNRL